jgi:hypothetical protein
MRRRKRLAVLAAVAALVAAGILLSRPEPPLRATLANLETVREGMTRAEVAAILGPPGNYASGPTRFHGPASLVATEEEGEVVAAFWNWYTDTDDLEVVFDASGRVAECVNNPNRRIEQGPLDTLLWRIQHEWRRWYPEEEVRYIAASRW